MPASPRLAGALLAMAFVTAACTTSETVTTDAEVAIAIEEPMPPVAVAQPPGQPGNAGGEVDGATAVAPHDGPVDGRPVAWERANYRRAENVIDVYWWSGVEPCTVLDRVDVEVLDDEVVVTVLEGSPPEAAVISCVAMAQYKTTAVVLDQDLGSRRIVDGATR